MTLETGFAPSGDVNVYWESRGHGGTPLIVTHGGFGVTAMFGDILDRLATGRRVIAIELQGHGHTADVDRAFSFEAFGDQIAGVIDHLGLAEADLLGYSLGAQASLRCAIQHPEKVRRLIVVSVPCRRDGWLPEVRAGMDQISSAQFEMMKHSPVYQAYAEVARDPAAFPRLMDKTGDLLRTPFDWSGEVRRLAMPTLLVYGDADSVPTAHAAEFYALLGGGVHDAGWDGSEMGTARLAILPGVTHYNIFTSPQLATVVADFIA